MLPFLNLTSYPKNESMIINAAYIIRATPLKDDKGSLLLMADGSKLMVGQDLSVLNTLLGITEAGVYE